MSKYYNPVTTVKQKGKKVEHVESGVYPLGRFQNMLVAVSDNGLFERAVDVTKQSEFDLFYQQYYEGMWLNFDLYDYKPQDDPARQ